MGYANLKCSCLRRRRRRLAQTVLQETSHRRLAVLESWKFEAAIPVSKSQISPDTKVETTLELEQPESSSLTVTSGIACALISVGCLLKRYLGLKTKDSETKRQD